MFAMSTTEQKFLPYMAIRHMIELRGYDYRSVRLQEAYINRETKNDISEKILEVCDWKADIIWYDTLSHAERIYKEICKGVQIA